MIPWEFLGSTRAPGGGEELSLYRHGNEFSIRVRNRPLMDSTVHGSEDALAELACARIAQRASPRILIGGLGMGFTTGTALRHLGPAAQVVVAELVPAVVEWNRTYLGDLAGRPLEDSRVTLRVMDVAEVLRREQNAYDAILLDVDNGPQGLTRQGNNWLYADVGLGAARTALRDRGVLAVWSAGPERAFARRLRRAGFTVEEVNVRARGDRGGRQHVVWLAQRGP
jgi:spermidine synthase